MPKKPVILVPGIVQGARKYFRKSCYIRETMSRGKLVIRVVVVGFILLAKIMTPSYMISLLLIFELIRTNAI
jgi:hypothetical protein